MSRDPASRGRCLLVWSVATVGAALLLGWLLPHLAAALVAPPGTRFEDWLVVGCEAAAAGAATWLWVLVSLVALEAAGATTGRDVPVPGAVRRLVLAACGAGLVGGLVGPAHAAAPPSPLAGLPLPDRATAHALPRPDRPRGAAPAADHGPDTASPAATLHVAAGDSLWALAAADLPTGAPAARVDERWREIHDANRDVIGEDPDLILPGQQLRLPPGRPSTT